MGIDSEPLPDSYSPKTSAGPLYDKENTYVENDSLVMTDGGQDDDVEGPYKPSSVRGYAIMLAGLSTSIYGSAIGNDMVFAGGIPVFYIGFSDARTARDLRLLSQDLYDRQAQSKDE